jgi:hypothetical protein
MTQAKSFECTAKTSLFCGVPPSIFLTTARVASNIADTEHTMRRSLAKRFIAVAIAIAIFTLANVAIAHSHPDAKAIDEAHCRICLAAHSGVHGIVSAAAQLEFVQLVTRSAVPDFLVAFVSVASRAAQDRAPPSA